MIPVSNTCSSMAYDLVSTRPERGVTGVTGSREVIHVDQLSGSGQVVASS